MRIFLFSACLLLMVLSGCGPIKEMYEQHEAKQELERKAEDGNVEAQYELGRRFSNKEDGESLAIYWLCRAGSQGHTGAQYTLAGIFERRANQSDSSAGRDKRTLDDRSSAYYWYTAAAAQGHERAFSARESLGSKMSPGSIADAKRRARRWREAQCIK